MPIGTTIGLFRRTLLRGTVIAPPRIRPGRGGGKGVGGGIGKGIGRPVGVPIDMPEETGGGGGPPPPISPPTVDADYVFVANLDTGQAFYAKAGTTQAVPASLVKLLTALVVAQVKSGALGDTLTVVAGDFTGLSTFSQMGLQTNDVISFTDLLHGILLASGSEACQAAARVCGDLLTPGGGVSRFVTEMNTLAAALGMGASSFTNTYGLSETGHHSTAADLWLLIEAAFADPDIAPILDTAIATAAITGANARAIFLSNSNPILEDEGVLGGKTGSYLGLAGDPAIYNLANIWAAPNGERVGIVTLHSDTAGARQADQRAIIAQMPVDFPALAVSIAPDSGAGTVLLENNLDRVLLEDGTSALLLEGS